MLVFLSSIEASAAVNIQEPHPNRGRLFFFKVFEAFWVYLKYCICLEFGLDANRSISIFFSRGDIIKTGDWKKIGKGERIAVIEEFFKSSFRYQMQINEKVHKQIH